MDLTFSDHGSIVILFPNTAAGQAWIDEHIAEDALRWGDGVVIEPRYAAAIMSGASDDGLQVVLS